MNTPADLVIAKFGGHRAVADVLGLDLSRVYRFTYPKARGGSDGVIPAKHQRALLDAASVKDIDLRPEDFFAQRAAARAPKADSGRAGTRKRLHRVGG